jgi:hypothetical protein
LSVLESVSLLKVAAPGKEPSPRRGLSFEDLTLRQGAYVQLYAAAIDIARDHDLLNFSPIPVGKELAVFTAACRTDGMPCWTMVDCDLDQE